MKKIVLTALALAVFTPPPAQSLTIDEAVELALANNHRIKEARHVEQSAAAHVGTSRSSFFPSLDVSYNYSASEQERFNLGNQSSIFSVALSYNLFSGKADTHRLAESHALASAASYQRSAVESDIVLAVKWAYIDVLSAARSVETAAEGVALLEDQKHESERYLEQGLIARNDLLRVEVELSSARQKLLRAQGDSNLARKALVRLLGTDLGKSQHLETFTELPELEDLSFDSLKEEMMGNRSEILHLMSRQTALEENRDSRKAVYLPQVDVVLSHDNFGDTLFPGGQDEGFDSDTTGRVLATWNLYNGKRTRHDVQQAEYLARANAEALEDTAAELVLQLETALERYRVARGNTETARVAVEQAEENYRVNESLSRQRLGTTTDLVDARFFLTRSRNEHTDALAETFKAVAGLERVLERPRPRAATSASDPKPGEWAKSSRFP